MWSCFFKFKCMDQKMPLPLSNGGGCHGDQFFDKYYYQWKTLWMTHVRFSMNELDICPKTLSTGGGSWISVPLPCSIYVDKTLEVSTELSLRGSWNRHSPQGCNSDHPSTVMYIFFHFLKEANHLAKNDAPQNHFPFHSNCFLSFIIEVFFENLLSPS